MHVRETERTKLEELFDYDHLHTCGVDCVIRSALGRFRQFGNAIVSVTGTVTIGTFTVGPNPAQITAQIPQI